MKYTSQDLARLAEVDRAHGWLSGPATVRSWQWLATEYRHDPLLFLESIPSHEARVFAKHVLTNYWIYRDPGPEQDGRYAENR